MTEAPICEFDHPFDFDPTYGYTLGELLNIRPPDSPPPDFAAFWSNTIRTATKNWRVEIRQASEPPAQGWRLEIFRLRAADGGFFGAWYLAPVERQNILRAFVIGHGYGGRAAIDWPVPFTDAAYLFPCARGFHISAQAGIPDNVAEHVIHGIASPETYLLRQCVSDLEVAAALMSELHPEFAGRLGFMGGSFGGGLGALLLPWSSSFKRAFLKVPTFGHHPLRLGCRCVGSGESVRLAVQANPATRKTLAYFDAATAASHINIPVFAVPALFDPAVPPPGQFAVANALAGHKQVHVLRAAHFEHPALALDEAALARKVAAWFQSFPVP